MGNSESLKLQDQLKLINEVVSKEIYNLGDTFFEKITSKLNDALGADYTFIGELNDEKTEIETLALVNKEGIIQNFSYSVKDTPCENVIGQTACSYSSKVASLFPKDQLLSDMSIEAYIGVPLFDSKSNPTGILVCMFTQAMINIAHFESILLIFASRAGAELEHLKLYKILDQHNTELERRVLERTQELKVKNTELEHINNELEQAMRELSATQTQLIQSEKMASLGILTAGVAHELNNPLNFILGGHTGLKNYFEETGDISDSQVDFYLTSINEGVERASKIIDSLNQFSRTTENFDENCDIHKILDDCLLMLKSKLHNRVNLKKDYTTTHAIVRGNQGNLRQVFLNILNNSIEAIERTGEIQIQTKLINSFIEIQITDSGYGISEQDLEDILNPFYTTKRPGEGTGLGLSITYSILKDHKGSITFDSEKGEYTKVNVRLPLKTAKNE